MVYFFYLGIRGWTLVELGPQQQGMKVDEAAKREIQTSLATL